MTGVSVPGSMAATRPTRMPQWAKLGVVFGFVSIGAILLFGPIGVSSTYPRFIGEIWRLFDPASASANPYLVKVGALLKPETMLVVGLLIGGFIGAHMGAGAREGGAAKLELVHGGETTAKRRYLDAFLGGVFLLFGARLAGGCTSGHIISGITQLAVSSIVFAVGVFATGVITAKALKGRMRA